AFQRDRHWRAERLASTSAAGLVVTGHPILGLRTEVPGEDRHGFSGEVSAKSPAWLDDHRVLGRALYPGMGFAELALAAGRALAKAGEEVEVRGLTFEAPLVLPKGERAALALWVEADRSFAVHSRLSPEAPWTRHATGVLAAAGQGPISARATPPEDATQV